MAISHNKRINFLMPVIYFVFEAIAASGALVHCVSGHSE